MSLFQSFAFVSLGVLIGSVGLLSFLRYYVAGDLARTRGFLSGFVLPYKKSGLCLTENSQTCTCEMCGWVNVPPRPMVTPELLAACAKPLDLPEVDEFEDSN